MARTRRRRTYKKNRIRERRRPTGKVGRPKGKKGKKEKMAKKATGRGSGLKNMRVSFKKVRKMTLLELFGKKPISPPEIMKTIWKLIKKKKLVKKKKV